MWLIYGGWQAVVVLLRKCALVAIYIVIGALLCAFCLVTYLCYGNWQLLQATNSAAAQCGHSAAVVAVAGGPSAAALDSGT